MSQDDQSRRIRDLSPGGQALNTVAWSPDGTRLAVGSDDENVYVQTAEGHMLWEGVGHTKRIWTVEWSPDGQRIASASEDGSFRIWDSESGALLLTKDDHTSNVFSIAWSPDGSCLVSGSWDKSVRLWDPLTGHQLSQFDGHEAGVYGVAWSPDGLRLASCSSDKSVIVWDVAAGTPILKYKAHEGAVYCLAWSPDGRRLASGDDEDTIQIWEATTGESLGRCEGHTDDVRSVAWSRDRRHFVSASADSTVRMWNADDGRELKRIGAHTDRVWSLQFSPDGSLLASASDDRTVALWDVADLFPPVPVGLSQGVSDWLRRQAATVGRRSEFSEKGSPVLQDKVSEVSLPSALAALPGRLMACHRLNIFPPLSLIKDLDLLLSGQPVEAFASLASDSRFQELVRLRWHGPARIGLIALLLREVPDDRWQEWKKPADLLASKLRHELIRALGGDAIAPEAPAPPLASMTKAVEKVDQRLLTLLCALGEDAVAADPGLPLRILPEAPSVPKMSELQRQRLGIRLQPADSGPAQGAGQGTGRTGLSPQGSFLSLAPSQFAYPRDLMEWRHQNGGLLYRARTGREPPQFRPAVLVLDTSPASNGPVEVMTRGAAYILASTLREMKLPVVLVDGEAGVHLLEEPADLLKILTLRTLEPMEPPTVLEAAHALRAQLNGGLHEPVVVLLTHSWWGAESEASIRSESARGLFVHFPGQDLRPPWADRCGRWEALGTEDWEALGPALGRLIG